MTTPMNQLIRVARGQAEPDLVLINGQVLNVFTGALEEGNVAIADGRIAGIAPDYQGSKQIDCQGLVITPGLIDAHVHIESSLCTPREFGRTVSARGVTTVMADPHEIANVAGTEGILYMHERCRDLPLDVKLMAPSCVPACHLETSGADLGAEELWELKVEGIVHGLAEMMNYPGILNGDPKCMALMESFQEHSVDGHAPQLSGLDLNAYLSTGIGSDHECVSRAEAEEKLAKGMYILIREGTITRDLEALLPMVTPRNMRRICFCTDDRIPADLLTEGSVDFPVRQAIALGLDPLDALCMATLNPAEWFGLRDRGAVSPGRRADLVAWSDLSSLQAVTVLAGGEMIVSDGQWVGADSTQEPAASAAIADTVQVDWDRVSFHIPAPAGASQVRVRVIGSIEKQIVTEALVHALPVVDGGIQADPAVDILKISVIERHGRQGSMASGFIRGFGLQRGALAGTIAHDHHNLMVIGADDASMMRAARAVTDMGGGIAVATADAVLESMPLPVAGLMSDAPIAEVHAQYRRLQEATRQLGGRMYDPLMAMSFMGLEVVPSLKITDRGLVDVDLFDFVSVTA